MTSLNPKNMSLSDITYRLSFVCVLIQLSLSCITIYKLFIELYYILTSILPL